MSKKVKKSIEDTYKKMSPIEHIKTLPDTYIGSVEETEIETYVYDDISERMIKKKLTYVPGLYKIFDEIIVNAADQVVRLKEDISANQVTTIKVDIDQKTNTISVYNDGDGIDVEIHKEHEIYVPELIFGNLLTSANYDKNQEKTTGGKNGYGSKLCNVFSTMFKVETVDAKRKKKYVQTFTNNMSEKTKPKITSCKTKPYTCITFSPDLELFGMKELDDDIIDMMKKRVYDMTACTDEHIKVYLNNVKIPVKTFERYVDLYIGKNKETKRVYQRVNHRWEVAVCLSPDDKLEHISFVNSICTSKGGKHVDYISGQIARKVVAYAKNKIKDKKKQKNFAVKVNHVKDNLWVFIKSTIVNPSFDSQIKETLTTPSNKFGSSCDFDDKFIEKVAKTGILDKAMMLSSYKEKSNMKKSDGKKKKTLLGVDKLDDANLAGTARSSECTLILTEGDSAKSLCISGLSVTGRDLFGAFPLKGKLLNVREATEKQKLTNEEINNLKKIIGLQQYETGTNKPKVYKDTSELRYGHILLFCDADTDGSHIKGLLMNMFHYYWPSLLKIDGFIQSLATPIIKTIKGKTEKSFFTLSDYEEWKENNDTKGWEIRYLKGLGTSTAKEGKEYFTNYHKKVINYHMNKDKPEDSDNALLLAFEKKQSDNRKTWLLDYKKDIVLEQNEKEVKFEEFINKELIHFSNYDNERSIPSICDGLKPGQRKVLFSCFKRNLTKRIKVAQLAGYVSEQSAYHHGEASLHGTIINMAQNYIGSNNINLLEPLGQFGTIHANGKDSASPRYIFTNLSQLANLIFHPDDFELLNYLNDDGSPIEPEWYIPIIPMILVNGGEGIGTGFSTKIPPHNPLDIIDNLIELIDGNKIKKMKPWFRKFTGSIVKDDSKKYSSHGVYKVKNDTTVEITELPIGKSINDYTKFIESLLLEEEKDNKKKKKEQILKSYLKNHTEERVHFTLIFNKSTLSKILECEGLFEKIFKLVDTKNTGMTNMHLHDRHGNMKKYKSSKEIIKEFYEIRLEYYVKRKAYLLKKLKHELDILKERVRFIEHVIDEKVIVFNRSDENIYEQLEEYEFKQIALNVNKEPSYDYLINMAIRSLTKKKIKELKKIRDTKQDEYDTILKRTPKEQWKIDLNVFKKTYKKLYNE